MVKSKRAFHDFSGSQHKENAPDSPVDINIDLGPLNLIPNGLEPLAPAAAKLPLPSASAPRELRTLDPLVHNSQASSVPNLAAERLLAQSIATEFRTVEHATPPLAGTRYPIIDQGIADPHILRLSMYNIPSSKAQRDKTGLPLGLIVRPFAAHEPPLVDWSDAPDVPRCGRCRAYVNPGSQFVKGGTHFVCNLCHFTTRVPDWYFKPLLANMRRPAGDDELVYGCYDIKLPKMYHVESSEYPRYVFLIDVTRDSLNKGIPNVAGEAILEVLYAQNCLPENARVAIMSFAKALHMYRLSKGENDQVEMLVQYDVEDPVIPPDIFFDPYECFESVNNLLKKLPEFLKENWEPKSCFGGAAQAALAALDKKGGRVLAFNATMPSVYPGFLERRDTRTYIAHPGNENDPEHQLFLTPNKFYRELADRYAQEGAGFDLFAFPTGFQDIATLSLLPKKSGGSLNVYPRYVASRDSRAFMADLIRVCAVSTYTHCAVKVRASLGLQVEEYWGVTADTPTGIMDPNTCFAVSFAYDDVLDPRHDAYFQAAVMYTNHRGERYLRVANIPAGITDQFKNVLKFVDSDACTGILARQAVAKMPIVPLEEIRKGIMEKYYEIFGACRAYAGGPLPPSQMLMPTALRAFLPYGNALLKSVAFTEKAYSVDGRAINAYEMSRASADELALMLYPRCYSVEKLFEFDGDFEEMPMIGASSKNLGTCTLLFDGKAFTLYITQNATQKLLEDLFGVDALEKISAYIDEIPVLETEINQKVRALCDWLALRVNRSWIPLQIAREELDGSEYIVKRMLVDDQHQGQVAYVEFLGLIHTQAKKRALSIETRKNWL